jgi:hypothetical protein
MPNALYQRPTVDNAVYKAFGMQPNMDRLNLLPRKDPRQGWIAPNLLYQMARAVVAPGVAAHGGDVSPEDALNFAGNVSLGGIGVSSAMKNPAPGSGKTVSAFVIKHTNPVEGGTYVRGWSPTQGQTVKASTKNGAKVFQDASSANAWIRKNVARFEGPGFNEADFSIEPIGLQPGSKVFHGTHSTEYEGLPSIEKSGSAWGNSADKVVWAAPTAGQADFFATHAAGGPTTDKSRIYPMRIKGNAKIKYVANWTELGYGKNSIREQIQIARSRGYDVVHFARLNNDAGEAVILNMEAVETAFGK